jgi:carbonic anhydrase
MSNHQITARVTPAGSRVGRATGFELANQAQPDAPIGSALERNRAFAAGGGHEGAVVFPTLRLFVITCLDPRVDPAHFLGLGLGDAMVVRNVGGRVTPEVINDVAFIGQLAETALPDGPLFEVAVIHHTQCGTGALADDAFRRRYAKRIGADESALREHAVLDPVTTITRDVDRLRFAPAISPRVTVSGHVYDVRTGLVQTILPAAPRDHCQGEERPPLGRDLADTTRHELDTRSFDPTQGRKIGSDPYDDPTQGRKIGSDPYDDPTRAHPLTLKLSAYPESLPSADPASRLPAPGRQSPEYR